MRDTNIVCKEQAFKVAIINEFSCETFEEFINALRKKMNYGDTVLFSVKNCPKWVGLYEEE